MNSKCIIIHLLFIVMAIRHISSQQDAEVTIIEQPQSLNITSESEAHFTCKARAARAARAPIVKWRANGSVIDSDFTHSYPDGPIRISHLTWPADQVHNGTRITCVAASETTASVESEPAFLLIQGVLDSPTEVEAARFNDSHITISWTAPFTLDITNLDPDITYCVYINSKTPCMTTTDTSYIFEAECSPVLYRVRACYSNSIEIGCSDNATVMYPQVTIGFTLMGVEVMYGSDGDLLVHIHLQNEAFCSRGYSGLLEYRFGDGLDGSIEIDPPIMPDINGTVHLLTLPQPHIHILQNARYNGSIGSDGMMIEVNFLTFDVQDVTVNYTSEQDGYGNILVTCVFARGTRALGCIVVFRNGPTTRNITILRSEEHGPTEASSVMYHPPDGEYEVIAYDLEFDGTVDTDCEHVQRIFMFAPPTVPSLMPSTIPPTVITTGGSSEDNVPVNIGAVVAVLVVIIVLVAVAVTLLVGVLLKRNVRRKTTDSTLQKNQDLSNGDSPDDLSKREAALPPRRLELQFVGGGYAEARDTSDTSSAPHPPSQPRVEYAEIQKPANPNSQDRQPDSVMPDGVVQKGLRHRRI